MKTAEYCGYTVEATQKPETTKNFVPQTVRWQVERPICYRDRMVQLLSPFK